MKYKLFSKESINKTRNWLKNLLFGKDKFGNTWEYERCKGNCEGKRNCVSWSVTDETWKRVVPEELQNKVLCLSCFDEFAQKEKVDYSKELEIHGTVTWVDSM